MSFSFFCVFPSTCFHTHFTFVEIMNIWKVWIFRGEMYATYWTDIYHKEMTSKSSSTVRDRAKSLNKVQLKLIWGLRSPSLTSQVGILFSYYCLFSTKFPLCVAVVLLWRLLRANFVLIHLICLMQNDETSFSLHLALIVHFTVFFFSPHHVHWLL